jgi:hypothetical protein
MLLAKPDEHMSWGGNAQNLLLTGAAWVLADHLGANAASRGQ